MTSITETPTAPIFRLPNELLSRVFEQYVEDWEAHFLSEWSDLWQDLRSFLLVCRMWYNVAFQTPRLWRNVWHGQFALFHTRPAFFGFKFCIRHSGAVPINLSIHGFPYMVDVLKYLASAQELHRIDRIHLSTAQADNLSNVARIATLCTLLSFPSLRPDAIFIALTKALSTSQINDLLRQHSTVMSMRIWRAYPKGSGRFISSDPPTTFARLQTLQVGLDDISDVRDLLSIISAPLLQHLAINAVCHKVTNDMPRVPLPVMISLRTLTLQGVICSEMVKRILQCTPNIDTLQLMLIENYSFIPKETDFSYLYGDVPIQQIVVPKLHVLNIQRTMEKSVSLQRIVDSRLGSSFTVPLKAIGLLDYVPHGNVQEYQLDQKVKVYEWKPLTNHQIDSWHSRALNFAAASFV